MKNKNKSLYIGYSRDLQQRLRRHKSKRDVELIYYEAFKFEKEARDRERNLKLYGSAWRGLKRRLELTLSEKA